LALDGFGQRSLAFRDLGVQVRDVALAFFDLGQRRDQFGRGGFRRHLVWIKRQMRNLSGWNSRKIGIGSRGSPSLKENAGAKLQATGRDEGGIVALLRDRPEPALLGSVAKFARRHANQACGDAQG
jgi:hypothetical protein